MQTEIFLAPKPKFEYKIDVRMHLQTLSLADHSKTARRLWVKLQTRPVGLERCNFAAKVLCLLPSAMKPRSVKRFAQRTLTSKIDLKCGFRRSSFRVSE